MHVLIDYFFSSFELFMTVEIVLLNCIVGVKNHKNLVLPLTVSDHLLRP